MQSDLVRVTLPSPMGSAVGSLWLLDNLIGAGCIVGVPVVAVLLPTRTLWCWPQEGAG